jgi:hypothetical protein
MNIYKIRCIVDRIRRTGRLPTDPYGQILCGDDIIAWYGLEKMLTADEKKYLKHELIMMAETEAIIDQMKI